MFLKTCFLLKKVRNLLIKTKIYLKINQKLLFLGCFFVKILVLFLMFGTKKNR